MTPMNHKMSEKSRTVSRRKRPRRTRQARRAAVIVEFAMCLPILFAFMLAIIEFSRLMQIQHVVREAAFEGAREAASLDATTTTVQTQVNKVLSAGNLSNPTTTITDGSGNTLSYSSSTARVSISVDPAGNSWLLRYVLAGHPVTGSITVAREIQAVSVPGP